MEITIDLREDTEIKSLKARFLNSQKVWVYSPRALIVTGESSKRGKFGIGTKIIEKDNNLIDVEVDLTEYQSLKSRYIKLTIPSYGMIPDGLQGAGHNSWTFIDEIVIE